MTDLQALWAGPEWRSQAEQWIQLVLESFSVRQTGPIEQPRIRFWSTQLTVPTDLGVLWFKENNPGQLAEASVVAALAELVPDHVVKPLAVEPSRGWMITPDHGATLASLRSNDYQLWARVLTDFADLQKALIPHADRLTAAGLVNMNPEVAANFVENQLLLHTGLPAEHPMFLSHQGADHVLAQLPRIRAAVETLRALGVPLSLDHNDLHPRNAFLPGSSTEPLRFFDFADAYWAHPFSALLVPITLMCEQWATTPADPRVRLAVGAYLEQWTDFAPLPALQASLDSALYLGRVHRYGAWLRLLVYADDASMSTYGPGALEYLADLTTPILSA
ncbi:phosphotransferase [uncultured Arthrobacter sp.]|uniref:phosphotransferase n=1 Tax=uncultured Arthrobacter sp. TaxID=114050 RepID=UPI0025DC08CA|nr:phosphotransferase [uncultured Arthrobacter sp.]